MAKSIFLEKEHPPQEAELHEALAESQKVWQRLLNEVQEEYPKVKTEWKYYGKAWGWCLVVKSAKKTLVYLTPGEGSLTATFVFGEKAELAARQAVLPEVVWQQVAQAHITAQTKTFDMPVQCAEDILSVKKLAKIRYEN
jgi:hypothetical protein